jgi:hypothetical protein
MVPPRLKTIWDALDPQRREMLVRFAESMAEENRLFEALATGHPTVRERFRIEAAI